MDEFQRYEEKTYAYDPVQMFGVGSYSEVKNSMKREVISITAHLEVEKRRSLEGRKFALGFNVALVASTNN